MNSCGIAGMAVVAWIVAVPASAQSASAPEPAAEAVHRFEVGAGIGLGAVLSGSLDDLATPGPGLPLFPSVRVGVNLSPRFALELQTDFDSHHELQNEFGPAAQSGIIGAYSVRVRQTLGSPRRRWVWFVTYGAAGQFNRVHESETRWTWDNGDVVVWPGSTHERLTPPVIPLVGFGSRTRLRDRLVFEVGAQVKTLPPYAFVPTASATLVILLGK